MLTIYYQLGQDFITNWGSFALLQIGAAQLLQNGADVITNWGKLYHRFGQLLQIEAIITNWDIRNTINILLEPLTMHNNMG